MALTDKELKAKLESFVKLGNELDAEAKRRYGSEGFLFHEADGGVHLMDGDEENGNVTKRQKHSKFSSIGIARWGAGAW